MNRGIRALVLGGIVLAAQLGSAVAAPQDYRFELVGKPVRAKDTVTFSVRLVRTQSGEAVSEAMIEAVDFNMTPEGMAGSNPVAAMPVVEPGVQRFQVQPEMPGRWELQLIAHVSGEPADITGHLVIAVPP